MKTAEDMDKITLTKDNETTAGKIKLDLDLPYLFGSYKTNRFEGTSINCLCP